MQFFTLSLPVKGYVKKYLQQKYGCPLTLSANDVFSDVLLAMLLVPVPTKRSRQELDQQLGRRCHRLDIRIPFSMFYRLPKEISEHSQVRINTYFENRFREEFCDTVERLVTFGKIERQLAIEHFAAINRLEMDEDISFDCLKKMEYRYRKEREEKSKKSLPELSSVKMLFQ